MSTLHEITDKHRDLIALSEESEDMAQAIADTMEAIEGEFEGKALSLMSVVSNMGADVLAIKSEIERLNGRKKAIENRQASMKEYLKMNMEASGINKIKCPLFTITLAKGRDIVRIDDIDKLPTDYLDIKTVITPMKREILAALKAGEIFDGASLVKSSNSIRIK